jgi:AraC-like DNA-binding protein
MIGISDTKYFSRNFKKKFEMTPGEFKKRYTNKISEQL